MNSAASRFLSLCLLPLLAMAYAADQAEVSAKYVDVDLTVDDLAHSFFYHSPGAREQLQQVISADGVERISPDIAAHQRQMDDVRAHAGKLRRLCGELQGSRNGPEFAAALANSEQRERDEQREAARLIVSKLDDADRKAFEDYLETQFRQGVARSTLDVDAMFSFAEFPSERTNAIASRICTAATQAEGIIQQ